MRAGRPATRLFALLPALGLAAAPARADEVAEEALRLVARHHLMHPDPARLARGTPAALVASLRDIDPAAQWWPPDIAAANRGWAGERPSGIGASVIEEGERILLVPLPGGPLARQGVSRPVRLLALAGQPVERLGAEGVQRLLGDPAQDPVDLAVQDPAGGPPAAMLLRRGPYHAVAAERLAAGGRTVLRIHRFVQGVTLREVREALRSLPVEAGTPVLDLRYCPGGDLFEALDVASLFLPPGLVLATLEEAGGRRTVFRSVGSGPLVTGPVAILVGPATASAAETLAAVLRDRAGARLVGMPTFGKCLAQSAFPLADGSVLLISTGRILTGAGHDCAGQGLVPDVPVDRAEADSLPALLARAAR